MQPGVSVTQPRPCVDSAPACAQPRYTQCGVYVGGQEVRSEGGRARPGAEPQLKVIIHSTHIHVLITHSAKSSSAHFSFPCCETARSNTKLLPPRSNTDTKQIKQNKSKQNNKNGDVANKPLKIFHFRGKHCCPLTSSCSPLASVAVRTLNTGTRLVWGPADLLCCSPALEARTNLFTNCPRCFSIRSSVHVAGNEEGETV